VSLEAATKNETDWGIEVLTPCVTCKHRTGPMTCEAFDVTIPMPILTGEFDHKLPYPNDNGIQWEAK